MTVTVNGVNMENEPKWWGFEALTLEGDYTHLTAQTGIYGFCLPEHRAELIEALTGNTYLYSPSYEWGTPGNWPGNPGSWLGSRDLSGVNAHPKADPAFGFGGLDAGYDGPPETGHYVMGHGLTLWTLDDGTTTTEWRYAWMHWGQPARPPASSAFGAREPFATYVNRFHIHFGSPPGEPSPPAPFDGAFLGAACSNSGSNFASDYAPWSGDNEELVQITAAGSVPAGNTVIAAVATKDTNDLADCQVYDQRGNTWTRDGSADRTGGANERVQLWRCNVTTAIQAGDYLRFAVNVGSSLLSTIEVGGRCIGAYAFEGTLGSPTVASTAQAITSGPTIGSTPSGDVVVLALTQHDPDGMTGDADWSQMFAYVEVSTGAGDDNAGLIGAFLEPGGGDAWTGAIDQARDWVILSIGYTRS